MTADTITAIKKALEGVTVQEWTFDGPADSIIIWCGTDTRVCFMTSDGPAKAHAQFITACQPIAISELLSTLESLQREAEETLKTYYERQIEWSRQTFGPALRTKGIIDHIKKELGEIEADPHDLSEWVDVVILAMDGFWRHGGNAGDLFKALIAKQQKNMARTWPDWRTMSEDSAIEHDRSKDAPRAALSSTGDTHGN